MTQKKPFKIKLHPLMDEKTLNDISDATLEAIDGQLYKEPPLQLTRNDIGKEIKGQGIYLGMYEPVDRAGVALKKVFNVFAAPQDLTDISGKKKTFRYVDAVKRVSDLKGFYGHNGENYATDRKLYSALRNNTYKGGWIIPTRHILSSRNINGKDVMPDNLFTCKDRGSFAGAFATRASRGSNHPAWYWSCSEDRGNPSFMLVVRLADGNGGARLKDDCRLSCRPVRLVPIK